MDYNYMVLDKSGQKTRYYSKDLAMNHYENSGLKLYYWCFNKDIRRKPHIFLVYWKNEQEVAQMKNGYLRA